MADESGERPERRGYRRFEVHLEDLSVEVGMLGFKPTRGVVFDISRGGLKVKLEHRVDELMVGEDCLIHFVEALDRVNPLTTIGKICRIENSFIAIEFAEPLKVLDLLIMPRGKYRRRRGSERWHFCKDCTSWPLKMKSEERSRTPTSGELCYECLAKERHGRCRYA